MLARISSAADHVSLDARAERAAVCADCEHERAILAAELGKNGLDANADELTDFNEWAKASFPMLEPSEYVADALQAFQEDEREFDPTYNVTAEDPAEIEADIRLHLEEIVAQRRNRNTGSEIDNGVPVKVPLEVGTESSLLAEETKLEGNQINLKARRTGLTAEKAVEKTTDDQEKSKTAELRQLQLTFNQLRNDGMGTTKALRNVIKNAENFETKQHLTALLGRVALLQSALPGKPDVVNRLLNTAGLNLAAATMAGSFDAFMSAAEDDDALTDEDRTILRQVVNREEKYARTGTDVQTELGETITTENGETVLAHPEDQPFQFRDHVQGFARTDGSQHLRAVTTHGEHVTLDITGWPAADVGRASELLQLWAMTENEGQTGYLTSLTKLDWTDTAIIDPLALQQASQIVSALLGSGEGHDGDIFDSKDALGMIRWQAQLANQTGASLRGTRDEGRTNDALAGLGIRDEKGNLDLDVLRVFGDYSRDHWMTAPNYQDLREQLSRSSR